MQLTKFKVSIDRKSKDVRVRDIINMKMVEASKVSYVLHVHMIVNSCHSYALMNNSVLHVVSNVFMETHTTPILKGNQE